MKKSFVEKLNGKSSEARFQGKEEIFPLQCGLPVGSQNSGMPRSDIRQMTKSKLKASSLE